MNEQQVTRITIRQRRSPSSYSEMETAAASHLSIDEIRYLHSLGLIEGQGNDEETCYSEDEIIQFRRIRRLRRDLGINLAGVEVILHLLKRLEAVHQDLAPDRNHVHQPDETP